MRLRRLLLTLTLPIALGGCGALGGAGAGPTTDPSPAPSGTPWIWYASGSATPSPVQSGGSPAPGLPPVSYLPIDPACTERFTRIDAMLIPLKVTPGKGSLSVTWPRQYDSDYRITAVKQPLVAGNQPATTWQKVSAGTGCTVSATISGLKTGVPYVVWLDAPNTGHEPDGTRHLYSGRSTVVYPL